MLHLAAVGFSATSTALSSGSPSLLSATWPLCYPIKDLRGAILRGDGMKEMRTLTNDKREGRRETRENSRDTARGETECLLRDREEW